MSPRVPKVLRLLSFASFFFFNDTATTEIYTLSLHDALPIYVRRPRRRPVVGADRDRQLPARCARPLRVTHGGAGLPGGQAGLQQSLEQDGSDLPESQHRHPLVNHSVLIADVLRAESRRRLSRRGT